MANLDIGPLLAEIGQLLAQDVRADPEGAFLYVEAGDGWNKASISTEMSRVVLYRDVGDALIERLFDLWYLESPEKRWTTMQYDIQNGSFAVKFGYEDVESEGDFEAGRREGLDRARFGDKPIDYSDP